MCLYPPLQRGARGDLTQVATMSEFAASLNPPESPFAKGDLNSPYNIDEHAPMPITQVGQVVGEIAEVVAGADLDVVTQMPVEPHQHAAPPIVGIGQVQQAPFDQCIPLVEEMPVGTRHIQVGTAVE